MLKDRKEILSHLDFTGTIKGQQDGANNFVTHRQVTPHAMHGAVPSQCSTTYQTLAFMKKTKIMYIEEKAANLTGPARIGRVSFSKTGKMLYYKDQRFKSLKGQGFKSNYEDIDTGEDYWISGPRKDGVDRLYGERVPVEIDRDVREEYWTTVRNEPNRKHEPQA